MNKIILFTIGLVALASCDDSQTELDKFNKKVSKVICSTVFYCCKENDTIGIYDEMTYDICVKEVYENYQKSFTKKYYDVNEGKLDDVVSGLENIYDGNCHRSMDNQTQKEVENLFLTAFTPKLSEGDECNSDLSCSQGYCKAETGNKYVCVANGENNDPCGYNEPCAEGFICVRDGNQKYCTDLKVGDSCINEECGFDGQLSCDATTLKCVEAGEIGDPCESDIDCKSIDCVDGFCDIYDIVDAQCLD